MCEFTIFIEMEAHVFVLMMITCAKRIYNYIYLLQEQKRADLLTWYVNWVLIGSYYINPYAKKGEKTAKKVEKHAKND